MTDTHIGNASLAERVLIAAIMAYPREQAQIFESIAAPGVFTAKTLRAIYSVARELHERGEYIGPASLIRVVERNGGEKGSVISALQECEVDTVLSLPGWADQAKHLNEAFQIAVFKRMAERAETCADIESAFSAWSRVASPEVELERGLGRQIDDFLAAQQAVYDGKAPEGYTWGIPAIDDRMLIRAGHTYGVAGNKGHGKTKLAIQIIDENLQRGAPVLFFSLEMSARDIIARVVSRRANIDSALIGRKSLPHDLWERLESEANMLRTENLTIDPRSDLTTAEIITSIAAWKERTEVVDDTGLVIIDFLQRVRPRNVRREDNLFADQVRVAWDLAGAAQHYRVALVELLQLNKSADNARPSQGHVDGSGAMAQAVDGLLVLDLPKARQKDPASSANGVDEFLITIAKCREGTSFVPIALLADLRVGRFHEVSHRGEPELSLVT